MPTRHLMQPSEVWGERWNSNPNPLARRWMETVVAKQSMVVLAADRYTMDDLNQLLDDVAPHVSALKSHVDLVDEVHTDVIEEEVIVSKKDKPKSKSNEKAKQTKKD